MSIVLSDIFVYPVKALAGITQSQAEVRPRGLASDRRWVIVRPDGQFISQRSHPRLALITTRLTTSGVELCAPDRQPMEILVPQDGPRRPVQIWQDHVSALSGNPEAESWLQEFLGEPCHLAWMDPLCQRPTKTDPEFPTTEVSFADGYPCLILSEASLTDLNERLATPLTMDRFRPNLVVSGCEAYAEDTWTTLTMGEVRFRAISPCARCSVTTIDQATGVSMAPEPLQTLATYRQVEKGVIFGVNLVVEKPGRIQMGDSVEVELG